MNHKIDINSGVHQRSYKRVRELCELRGRTEGEVESLTLKETSLLKDDP